MTLIHQPRPQIDGSVTAQIAQDWINDHMKTKDSEFTRTQPVTVFASTWNVNAKRPDGSLDEWLRPKHLNSNGQIEQTPLSDLIVIGLQEMVELNPLNAVNNSATTKAVQQWRERLDSYFQDLNEPYERIDDKALVGVFIIAYVRKTLQPYVRDVRVIAAPVGFMGVLGNKGGCALRIALHDSAIVFVSSHLAAHRENVVGRNADFRGILAAEFPSPPNTNGMNLTNLTNNGLEPGAGGRLVDLSLIRMPKQGAKQYEEQEIKLEEHDLIIWMGDLNYRLDEPITLDETYKLIEDYQLNKNLTSLMKLLTIDQLNLSRSRGLCFQQFYEPTITFLPTYKYIPGTTDYDRRPDKKLRLPAWCDRILWRTNDRHTIATCLAYNSISPPMAPMNISDHHAVYANLSVAVKTIDATKERKVFIEQSTRLAEQLRSGVNAIRLEVSTGSLEYHQVRYDTPMEMFLTLRNTGETAVFWHFISKGHDSQPTKRWLTLERTAGLLCEAESISVKITLTVDRYTSADLFSGRDQLFDQLALRVEGDGDYFINVSGTYVTSAYGMPLAALLSQMGPVSALPLPTVAPGQYIAAVNGPTDETSGVAKNVTALSVPKEVWRLVNALSDAAAFADRDLFSDDVSINALSEEERMQVRQIRVALDDSQEFPAGCSLNAYMVCLVTLLQALPQALIPMSLVIKVIGGSIRGGKFVLPPTQDQTYQHLAPITASAQKLMLSLPNAAYNTTVYLLSYLKHALQQNPLLKESELAEMAVNMFVEDLRTSRDDGVNISDRFASPDDAARMCVFLREVMKELLTAKSDM